MPPALLFRVHALRRMFERDVSVRDIRLVLETGETLEDYPGDQPYPSRLVLGWVGDRPLHVVAAHDFAEDITVVITVYEPDPIRWEPDFRRRRP